MPSLPFLTLDVFTTTRYLGNPLSIVRIPHGHPSPPTQEQKQTIAKEFNLSETIFLHENSEDSADVERKDDAEKEEVVKVDIFTTDQELPFAGHPTVGTGFYLHNLRPRIRTPTTLSLLTKAGKIPVQNLPHNPPHASLEIPHNVHLHKSELVSKEMLTLFPAIPHEDYHLELCSIPVFSIVKGMTFALPRLNSLEALAKVNTQSPELINPELDKPWDGGLVGIFFYVIVNKEELKQEEDTTPAASSDGNITTIKWTVQTRMILGLLEDPATGSASCALASYLSLSEATKHNPKGNNALRHKFEFIQGVEMGRRSQIGIEVLLKRKDKGRDDGSGAAIGAFDEVEVVKVVLSGTAVKVMEGVVEY